MSGLIRRLPRGRVALVGALLGLALVLRLAVAIAAFGSPQSGDAREYDFRARLIASGQGFGAPPAFLHVTDVPRLRPTGVQWPGGGPTAFRPPLYPLLLAGLYAVVGPSDTAGRILQVLIGTAVVALTGLIAFQLWGWRVAGVALGLSAVFAPAIVLGRILLSEPLFVLLMLMAIAAGLQARRRPRDWRWPLATGLLCGLAMLTRSAGIALTPCIALLVWAGRPRFSRSSLLAPVIVLLAAAATLVPWTVRNAVVLHRLIPITDQGGYTLAGVYNSSAARDSITPWLWRSPFEDPTNRLIMASTTATESTVSSRLGSAALRFIADHPAAVPQVIFWNSIRLADLDPGREQALIGFDFGIGPFGAGLAVILLLITGALALAGTFTRAARSPPARFWLLPVALWVSTAAIQSGMRFRAPIDPFLLMLAALALTSGWTRWSARAQHRPLEGRKERPSDPG